ncbi:hypothetical protein [Nocardioides marmoraquaticus]
MPTVPRTARHQPLRDRDLTPMQRFLDAPDVYAGTTWVGPTLLEATLQSA